MTTSSSVPLSDADLRFLYGKGWGEADIGPWYRRLIRDSGAEVILNGLNIRPADWPPDGAPVRADVGHVVDDPQVASTELDIVTLIARQFREQWERDRLFEQASDRWRKTPGRVTGYVPSDAGSVRWTILREEMFHMDFVNPYSGDEGLAQANLADVMGACAAYLSVPHFIPAAIARELVTSRPLPESARPELRLPAPYVMVFHDGVPTAAAASDDDAEVEEWLSGGRLFSPDTLVIGAILLGDPIEQDDDTEPVYTLNSLGYLILARRMTHGMYGWSAHTAKYGDHPGGRLLYNYAGLLNWEHWTAPPKLPGQQGGKQGSNRQLRRLARTPEAEAGAWHGVRVLNYTAPPEEPPAASRAPSGRGRQQKYSGRRRAYWKPNVRRGVEGEDGKFVGPVYGPDAIEGETFVRRRTWVRGTVTRPDLPPPPDEEVVYRVPGSAVRRQDKEEVQG